MLSNFNPGSFKERGEFIHFVVRKRVARVERFELPSTVLETAILPLNYTRICSRPYFPGLWGCKDSLFL